MKRAKPTSSILRQFKKKSKKVMNKDLFTEFFYFNRERKVIEFLSDNNRLLLDIFLDEFLPKDMKDFITITMVNEEEEEVKLWYYEDEDLTLIIKVNWGFRKEEVSVDIDINNFVVTSIDEHGLVIREIDYLLLNDYIISFLTNQAKSLSEAYDKIVEAKKKK